MRADFTSIVDTLGVPEVQTIRDLTTTNVDFQEAVRDVIPRLRYQPALLNGAPVRQMVTYQQSAALGVVGRSWPGGRPSSLRPPRC